MPVEEPLLCKRARASRNKKVRGREYYGYCAAKKEKFFGFRLDLVVNKQGIPVSVAILPGAYHDVTPLYEITLPLPANSIVIGDKAFNCKAVESALAEFGISLMPKRRKNMKHQWSLFEQRFIIDQNRRQIETTFSIVSEPNHFCISGVIMIITWSLSVANFMISFANRLSKGYR